jgi:geranylgeranyl diphosphate synthase type I
MVEYFKMQKQRIAALLKRWLGASAGPLGRVNRFGPEACERLLAFTLRGKMIRGGLVGIGYELFRNDDCQAVTACGAALELVQSALLIHDDIMDRDTLRRGEKTLSAQYAERARSQGIREPNHAGEALGICLGDIGFFLAFHILGEAGVKKSSFEKLISLFARELVAVGAAQMLDVWNGAMPSDRRRVTEEEILNLYRYKTGRYTFSLPLAAGALLAGREEAVAALGKIGENLGVIFQIKDDELGLFGDERGIGKPIGSDVREGKITLCFAALLQKMGGDEKRRFFQLWGNPDLSAADIDFVRGLVRAHGIDNSLAETIDRLARRCRRDIARFKTRPAWKKEILFRLLEYSLSRKF